MATIPRRPEEKTEPRFDDKPALAAYMVDQVQAKTLGFFTDMLIRATRFRQEIGLLSDRFPSNRDDGVDWDVLKAFEAWCELTTWHELDLQKRVAQCVLVATVGDNEVEVIVNQEPRAYAVHYAGSCYVVSTTEDPKDGHSLSVVASTDFATVG